ncbi:3-hydroxybutyrate dehydrogenase [Endozoicomonas atrinae]|uniref:3-hydroxybutyrate dehydrogenase n=1 Tax=Endozoicomonas atrinae TaxID=1333660 RepID=UPI003AFFFC00
MSLSEQHANRPVALVTGGASGIGAAIARELARDGFYVVISDIDLKAAESIVATICEHGGSASTLYLDVTHQESIDACRKTIKGEFTRLDVLVNNAGIQHVAKLEEFPVDKWQLVIDVLLVGPAMLTRAFLPMMKEQKYGRIVNIGSIHGLIASPFKSAYIAAKHGLLGFSKTIALEVAEYDITINTICPAYVKTPLVEKQIADQAKYYGISEDEVISKIMLAPMPKQSFISLEEVTGSVLFLLNPVSRNMTGQTIVLDGAWTAR